ncbi:hypothetical protein R3W88_021742 [Solanum pinnatisectum]|uniref:Uncharacterized protein n=1 Tax=Solanum pinnatisectum TaxID=50273 RepID=A0AAV9LSP3_9SOLN|nr:hypothetical protein R3W88_021742 [Solanum pinnatisectum]
MRPSVAKKKVSKKAPFSLPDSLTDEDSLRFWRLEHQIRFVSFSKRPIEPGRVVNLEQLEASHCAVSMLFRAQKLSLLLCLCGIEFYEEHARLFYANLWVSADSGEWETLMLSNRIVLKDSLFKDVFGSKLLGDIPFMHGNLWPENFEISLENVKLFVSKTSADITNFGPLSLGFENHIFAHIVATTLIRKGSLSNISNRDVYVVYCLLENTKSSSSLPYGLLISRIIVDSLVDLSPFRPSLIDATYDTRTFSSMGYVLINDKWYRKESVQQRANAPKVTRISADLAALLLKEADLIKVRLDGLESHMQVLQDTHGKVLQLHKDSSTDVRLEVEGLKKQAIRSVNTILKEVNSIKTGADSAHNELAVTVHTSYSNFSKNIECTYDSFCRNVLNTLKYFLGRGR